MLSWAACACAVDDVPALPSLLSWPRLSFGGRSSPLLSSLLWSSLRLSSRRSSPRRSSLLWSSLLLSSRRLPLRLSRPWERDLLRFRDGGRLPGIDQNSSLSSSTEPGAASRSQTNMKGLLALAKVAFTSETLIPWTLTSSTETMVSPGDTPKLAAW